MKSKFHPPPSPLAPRKRRRAQDLRAPEKPQDRLREEDRSEQRDDRADAEREGEALDAGARENEEDERRDQGDHVGVDDRRDALLVALGDRREHRSARAHLLLDALEDDDVGVCGDADRENQAGDARQRQRDRDQLDQGEEEDGVDEQPETRDQPEQAVVEDQEQQDHAEAGEAGDQALVERLLAQGRRDRRLADQRELDRQGADPQHLGQVLGLGQGEVARDLGSGAAVDAVGVLLEVDIGREQLAVEDDREGAGELRGDSSSAVDAGCPVSAKYSSWPRSEICLVTSWNASWPSSVNSKVTLGWLVVGSEPCSGFSISIAARARAGHAGRRTARCPSPPRRVLGQRVVGRRLLDDDGALRDLEHLGVRRLLAVGGDEEVGSAPRTGRRPAAACRRRRGSRSGPLVVQLCVLRSTPALARRRRSTASISRL